MTRVVALLAASLLAGTANAADPAGLPAGYKLLYDQSFSKPDALKDLVATVPAVWKHGSDDGGYLDLAYDKKTFKCPYAPKHRSPLYFALIADKRFTDFVLDLELQSTIAPYGHQDMCLFYGFTSPEKYYYTHIAKAADPRAHNIFVVNDADRTNIAKETTKGVEWGRGTWHKVRLVRDTASGSIEVYFDDLTKPIMRATDKTFGAGYVGFGSFDDHGRVRNVKVYGPTAEEKRVGFFQPPAVK